MKFSIVPLMVCLMLIAPSMFAMAGSYWKEGSEEFKKGTKDHLMVTGNSLVVPYATPTGTWSRVNDGQPGGIVEGAYAYSPEGRMLLFGGSHDVYSPAMNALNSTWIYDTLNQTWDEVRTVSPSPRVAAQVVYDEVSKKYIMFGGAYWHDFLNETWSYDPKTLTWTNITKPVHPSARAEHAMSYDQGAKVILMYGGENSTKAYDDLWEFNSTTGNWTYLTTSYSPGPRAHHTMTYMSSVATTLLVGGGNDVWAFNHANMTWVPRQSIFSFTYSDVVAVYDKFNDAVVVSWFYTFIYHPVLDFWAQTNPDPAPGNMNMYGMVFDLWSGQCILHGGTTYDGQPSGIPSEASPYLMTYYLGTGQWAYKYVMSFNGYGQRMAWSGELDSALVYGGMYQEIPWMGRVWADNSVYYYTSEDRYVKKDDTSKTPQRTPKYHAMAWEPDRNQLVVNGGYYTESYPGGNPCIGITKVYSWQYDNWTQVTSTPAPPCRAYHSMVYQSAAKEMVLFGGVDVLDFPAFYFNDTWAYEPVSGIWQNLSPLSASPPARAFMGMVYVDSAREVYMFGGSHGAPAQYLSDLWAYNMTTNTWRNISQSGGPSARRDMGMAYDTKRNSVLIYGGEVGNGVLSNEVWEWDVATGRWRQITTEAGPGARDFVQMFYDPERDGFLVFGGHAQEMMCDTWLLKLDDMRFDGYYISQPFDTKGTAYFGDITWNASYFSSYMPGIYLKVRTGKDLADLTSKPFAGPDGTNSTEFDATVYNSSGIYRGRLNPVHNASRYIQYFVKMYAPEIVGSPSLYSVNITYNLIHNLTITHPLLMEEYRGLRNITWTSVDPDNDHLRFDVVLRNGTGAVTTIANGVTGTRLDGWNTSVYPNGNYQIRIVAYDDNVGIPLSVTNSSDWFRINNTRVNHPPTVVLQYPVSGFIALQGQVQLQWIGTDIDGDALSFHLYFGKNSTNLMNEKPVDLLEGYYMLKGNGTYYWTVIPDDVTVDGTCLSGIWMVQLGQPNRAPAVSLVSPDNAAVLFTGSVTLRWNGTDPDKDVLTYELFLSTVYYDIVNLNRTALRATTKNTSIGLNLAEGTYYWNVRVTDGKLNASGYQDGRAFSIVIPTAGIVVKITSPSNHSTIRGTVNFLGTAAPGTGVNIVSVRVRIDGGAWVLATGKTNWNYSVDTTKLGEGGHRIEAQAMGDQFRNSHIVYIDFTVKNAVRHSSVQQPFCLWPLVIAVIAVVSSMALRIYFAYRKEPRQRTGPSRPKP